MQNEMEVETETEPLHHCTTARRTTIKHNHRGLVACCAQAIYCVFVLGSHMSTRTSISQIQHNGGA